MTFTALAFMCKQFTISLQLAPDVNWPDETTLYVCHVDPPTQDKTLNDKKSSTNNGRLSSSSFCFTYPVDISVHC